MPRRCALAPLAITHLNVLFPRPPPPSSSTARRPRPANHPLDGPRVVLLHLRRRAARHPPPLPLPPLMLLLAPSPLFHSFSRRPLSFSYPLLSFRSLRQTEREAAMTRVNLPQTPGSIPTDLDFSLSLYLSLSLSRRFLLRLFLRRTADNCHPPVILLNQPPPPPLSPPR